MKATETSGMGDNFKPQVGAVDNRTSKERWANPNFIGKIVTGASLKPKLDHSPVAHKPSKEIPNILHLAIQGDAAQWAVKFASGLYSNKDYLLGPEDSPQKFVAEALLKAKESPEQRVKALEFLKLYLAEAGNTPKGFRNNSRELMELWLTNVLVGLNHAMKAMDQNQNDSDLANFSQELVNFINKEVSPSASSIVLENLFRAHQRRPNSSYQPLVKALVDASKPAEVTQKVNAVAQGLNSQNRKVFISDLTQQVPLETINL